MSAPSLTYTLTNGATADASQVMQNFNDLLNGITDGTKDITVSALTANGAANLKAAVTLGSSTSNDLTISGSLASTVAIKTNNSFDVGSSSKGLASVYLGNGGAGLTCRLLSASHATTRNYTIPDCGADANFVMTQLAQTITGVKTFSSGINLGNTTLQNYVEGTFTPTMATSGTAGTLTYAKQAGAYIRIGNMMQLWFHVEWTNWTGSPTGNLLVDFSTIGQSSRNTSNLQSVCPIYGNNLVAVGTPVDFLGLVLPNTNQVLLVNTVNSSNGSSLDASSHAGATTRAVRGTIMFPI